MVGFPVGSPPVTLVDPGVPNDQQQNREIYDLGKVLADVGFRGTLAHCRSAYERGARFIPLAQRLFIEELAQVQTLEQMERAFIRRTLRLTGGRIMETARQLGVSRTMLWRRLKQWPDLKDCLP